MAETLGLWLTEHGGIMLISGAVCFVAGWMWGVWLVRQQPRGR